MKNILRILSHNILILLALLLFMEAAIRLGAYAKSCLKECNPEFLYSVVKKADFSRRYNISRYDDVLGYAPSENIRTTIPLSDLPAWNGSTISTDNYGFRKTGNKLDAPLKGTILIAGDSFVAGAQVENHQTWGACLERETKSKVFNAGVFGYGTAQSLLRIETSIDRLGFMPDVIILQTLVGSDFIRDTFEFLSGWPRPAVIKKPDDTLGYAEIADRKTPGSKFAQVSSSGEMPYWYVPYKTSWVFNYIMEMILPPERFVTYKRNLVRKHPHAADKNSIIDWVIERFSRIQTRKIFLLQYSRKAPEEVLAERQYIVNKLKEYNLPYIDTYEAIHKSGLRIRDLYDGHHTPLGNDLVCRVIIESGLL